MRRSKILAKLRANESVIMPQVGRFITPEMVELVGMLGFDCIWIDMEHKSFELDLLSKLTLACRATDMDSMVRLVKGNYTNVIRTLEVGATGLMLPHCMSAKEAAEFVRMAKFQPLGRRAIDGVGVDASYGMAEPVKYLQEANDQTFLVVQIEDPEGVDDIEAIISVKGIDVIFVGPGDLSHGYGVFPDLKHELIQKVLDRLAILCEKAGKWWGTPILSLEHGQHLIEQGARFLTFGADVYVLIEGFKKLYQESSLLSKKK